MAHKVVLSGTGRLLISTLALAGITWSGEVRANDLESEALAREAKLLMGQKRYTEACPKLATSFRRAPSGEGILELAQCQKEEGKLATAYYSAREALDFAVRDRNATRAKIARELVSELEPRMPRLTVNVSLKISSIPGIVVKRDGAPLRPQEWGRDTPVDPGTHVVTAEAPGYKTVRLTVGLQGDGVTESIVLPELEPGDAGTGAGASASSGPLRPLKTADRSADTGGARLNTQKTIGIVAGAFGVTALGVGAFAAVHSASLNSDAAKHCNRGVCDAEGKELRSEGTTFSNAATLALIGGGLATAGGIALFITAPNEERARPKPGLTAVSVGPTGGWISGQW